MADDRTYVKLHDGFDEHPKVAGLSDKAFRTYVEALCYCSRNLTDGRIPHAVARKSATPRVWATLVESGLIEDCDNGYAVHDYLEHQRSAEQVKHLKQARREAGKRGGLAKANALASAKGVATGLPKQTPSKAVPDTETDKEKKNSSSSAAADAATDPFDDWWAQYPKKVEKVDARKAWGQVLRKGVKPEHLIEAVRRYPFPEDRQFVKHPAVWLRKGAYEDHLQPTLSVVGSLSTADIERVLGPDTWTCPQPPRDLTADQKWEWEQQAKREHRAERVRLAAEKLGRSA